MRERVERMIIGEKIESDHHPVRVWIKGEIEKGETKKGEEKDEEGRLGRERKRAI